MGPLSLKSIAGSIASATPVLRGSGKVPVMGPINHRASTVDPNRDTSNDRDMGPKPMPKSIFTTIQRPEVMGPQPRDWLADFYRTNNIGGRGGVLDQGARDYWSNVAKTKGINTAKRDIEWAAKNENTWGGPTKTRTINTGPRHSLGYGIRRPGRIPKDRRGGITSIATSIARGLNL